MAKNSKTFTKLALSALALGTAFTAANDALALEVGQCGTPDEISNVLRAEGQFPIFAGYRAVPTLPKNTFTSNANLTLGYNLERGSEAMNEQNRVCVGAKYTNIHLNNNANFALPRWAMQGGENSPHNAFIANAQRGSGDKVIFGANALVKDSNGREQTGAFLMVTLGNQYDIYRNQGTMSVTNLSNNSPTVLFNMVNMDLNQPNYQTLAEGNVVPAPRK